MGQVRNVNINLADQLTPESPWSSRTGQPPSRRARVSHWSPKAAAEHDWLPIVVADFYRLMRPPRTTDDIVPTPDAAQRALNLLVRVMSRDTALPTLVPRFGGGLQMEWHLNGVDLEVYIDEDGTTVGAWCAEGGREWEADEIDLQRLKKELSLLTQHDA